MSDTDNGGASPTDGDSVSSETVSTEDPAATVGSPMDDAGTKASIEYARDSSKQVLTLATAVLTLTLTFIDKVVKVGDLSGPEQTLLLVAWLLLLCPWASGFSPSSISPETSRPPRPTTRTGS